MGASQGDEGQKQEEDLAFSFLFSLQLLFFMNTK